MATWNESTIKSLQALTPANGDDAIVSGYHLPGDLGGGVFYWEGKAPAAAIAGTSAANAAITSASNAIPIEITTATAHGYVSGQVVLIVGVGGNTNANGTWIISVTSNTAFTLNGSRGNADYTAGGAAHTTTITTSGPHGLATGLQAMIAGVGGTTSVNVAAYGLVVDGILYPRGMECGLDSWWNRRRWRHIDPLRGRNGTLAPHLFWALERPMVRRERGRDDRRHNSDPGRADHFGSNLRLRSAF
jgi:hypothetical protein